MVKDNNNYKNETRIMFKTILFVSGLIGFVYIYIYIYILRLFKNFR